MSYNFKLVNCDTDSISFCKPDMSPFTEQEQQDLIDEINSHFPEHIKYADDGYFQRCVVLKAKNYILYDGKKIKVKGSSLKASTKSLAVKEFLSKVIETMVYAKNETEMHEQLKAVYWDYVLEACDIKDIERWSFRKTISSTMQESERANETKVMAALEGSDYQEGDRVRCFYRSDDTISLVENFNGDYNKTRLLKNLFDTLNIFSTVIPVKELVLNYSLKKNEKFLPGYQAPPPKEKKPRKPRKVKECVTEVTPN